MDNLYNNILEVYNQELESKELYNEEFLYNIEHDRIMNEAVQFVNEAYVGKTETLLQMEEQIGKIRMNLSRYDDFDSNPETQKLNRLFEKQFGMDVYALHMDPHKQINAFTRVLATNFDIAKNLKFSDWIVADRKDGYRFKPNNGFCINATIYYGLIAQPDLTDAEVLAILLHELGHNFADFLDNKIQIANRKMMIGYQQYLLQYCILISVFSLGILALPAFIAYKSQMKRFNNRENRNKEIKNQNNYNKFKGKMAGIAASISDKIDNISIAINRLNPLNYMYAKFAIYFRNLFKDEYTKAARESLDRRNEIIADKFAAVYGYGTELGSGLDKMGNVKMGFEDILEKLPGGAKMNKLWNELFVDITEFDCHPHHIQRINECIKTLEDELKQQDMDPKMKNVIKQQIEDMKKLTKQIADKVKSNPEDAQAAYDAYVYNELPDATNEKIEKEIIDEYNKALEKKKN